MADEGIVEQDAPQVGMAAKLDAEHVETFALEPIGRLPDGICSRHPCVIARTDPDLHAETMILAHRLDLIDNVETRLALEPIDRRHIDEKLEGEFAVIV